ncbi:electron transport complex subunit RsxC [Ruminococcaceae bacterium OttesenSCG-928-I18]|nr:electron transport complex subunit RsxC [Ruminococcaceae bacterium OttesenSCG-928-I18]
MPQKRPLGGIKTHGEWLLAGKQLAKPDEYTVFEPQYVFLPMLQHIGAPCEPIVEVGQSVKLGQPVGDTEEKVAAPVHASVSGTVKSVEEWPRVGGGKAITVMIQNDHRYSVWEEQGHGELPSASVKDRLAAIRKAGIVGMGGATFPTALKLDRGEKEIEVCILNGAECEPGLSADNALMIQQTQKIVRGLRYIMEICSAARGLIGIEEDKPRAIEKMRRACEDEAGIEVETLPSIYPQGGEKQLIYALTGREVPTNGGLPADVGVVVANVGTAFSVAGALAHGSALVNRVCTVSGDVLHPQNLQFPIGTLVGDLIEHCGGFKGAPSKVIVGGPMMGRTIDSLQVPMEKGANGILVYAQEHDHLYAESPCIRCNRCLEACPMRLEPWAIDRAYRKQKWATCRWLQAESCINCGCCTYVCPATRRLAEKIVEAKNELARQRKEAE